MENIQLKLHLPLFKEVVELLKNNPKIDFVCQISKEFENLWYNAEFRNLLWDEVSKWEGCNLYTRNELSGAYMDKRSCLMYYGPFERNPMRIEFFTHLINKLKNA